MVSVPFDAFVKIADDHKTQCIQQPNDLHQDDAVPTAVFNATLLNVALALLPRAVIAVMHTTMISASMTAYSTAVGPSSARQN
jgi:hypothetical protein